MRFAFIQTEKATCSVRALCRLLEVSPSGFYAWTARAESRHARRDQQLRTRVCASFAASRQRYGNPRIHADLRDHGLRVSRTRVVRLMQKNGVAGERMSVSSFASFRPVAANDSVENRAMNRRIEIRLKPDPNHVPAPVVEPTADATSPEEPAAGAEGKPERAGAAGTGE